MRKLSLLCLFLSALISLPACSGETVPDDPGQDPTSTDPAAPDPDPDPEPAPADYVGDPQDDASSIFDRSEILTFELEVTPENIEFLDSDPVAEEYVPATLKFEGEEYAEVGLRYKGSIGSFIGCTEVFGFPPSGAKTCVKLSMKVKINHTDSDLKFHGLKKLQFHAMNTDDTLMRERLSYYLFREMGVPAPRTAAMRLVINGEMAGAFLLVEQIDGRFTRSRFGDGGKGNLYKEVWPKHENDGAYLEALETNEDENPTVEKVQRLRQALDDAQSIEELVAVSDSWTERPYMMNFMAVDRTIVNDDGSMHWYCNGSTMESCDPHNFFWYEDEATDRLWLIPWDTDLAFRDQHITHVPGSWNDSNPDCTPRPAGLGFFVPPNCDPLISAWASFGEDYAQALQTLIDGPFSAGNVASLFDTWKAQWAPVVQEAYDTNSEHLDPELWNNSIEALKITTYRRRGAAEDIIDSP